MSPAVATNAVRCLTPGCPGTMRPVRVLGGYHCGRCGRRATKRELVERKLRSAA